MTPTRVLTEKELATELNLSPWTIRTLRIQSGLVHFRTAGRIFYRLESVLAWMDAQERSSSSKSEQVSGIGVLRVIR